MIEVTSLLPKYILTYLIAQLIQIPLTDLNSQEKILRISYLNVIKDRVDIERGNPNNG